MPSYQGEIKSCHSMQMTIYFKSMYSLTLHLDQNLGLLPQISYSLNSNSKVECSIDHMLEAEGISCL